MVRRVKDRKRRERERERERERKREVRGGEPLKDSDNGDGGRIDASFSRGDSARVVISSYYPGPSDGVEIVRAGRVQALRKS